MSLVPISIIAGAAVGWIFWRACAKMAMRERLSRALYKLGYLLYANTRCGKWFHERNVRKARLKFGQGGHSETVTQCFGTLQIIPIPCSFDNYSYIVVDTATQDAIIIDAGDGLVLYEYLESHSMTPKGVLTTHRHWDHCGGNAYLAKKYTNMPIYGSAVDPPDGVKKFLTHEQEIVIGSLEFIAYSTPGHTRGHMIYYMKGEKYDAGSDCLFTGDLLFLAGCGKLFEGTGREMLKSMDLVSNLPEDILIWPGHEYAVSNLMFLLTVDGNNEAARDKLTWARRQRRESLPTSHVSGTTSTGHFRQGNGEKATCWFMITIGRAVLPKVLKSMSFNEALVDLAGMRKRYVQRPDYKVDLNQSLLKDPIKQFDAWFQYATTQHNLTYEELNAFALSTVGRDGRPSCRMVLIKGYGPDGFRFFTNYNSRKGKELAENPYACLLAYWAPINLSVRIEGIVEKLPGEVADEYWPKRPLKSRASAYASDQSSVIPSREDLEERVHEIHEQCHDKELDIPRPKEWGGYILKPDRLEFWQGDDDRLHDRVQFRKLMNGEIVDNFLTHQGEGDWIYERLAP